MTEWSRSELVKELRRLSFDVATRLCEIVRVVRAARNLAPTANSAIPMNQ
jgi:hypothetical protein